MGCLLSCWLQKESRFKQVKFLLAFFPCLLDSGEVPVASVEERRGLLALCESAIVSNEGLKRQLMLTSSSSQLPQDSIGRQGIHDNFSSVNAKQSTQGRLL